jgi:hypothetical protein
MQIRYFQRMIIDWVEDALAFSSDPAPTVKQLAKTCEREYRRRFRS